MISYVYMKMCYLPLEERTLIQEVKISFPENKK